MSDYVKYTKFKNLKFLHPYKRTSYSIKLSSGKNEIILIKHLELSEYNLIHSYQFSMFSEINKRKGAHKNLESKKQKNISGYIYKHTLELLLLWK